MGDGRYWYSVCVAEPESFLADDVQEVINDNQVVEIEPLNAIT